MSVVRDEAADIAKGSRWCREDGTCAVVRSVAQRHVVYTLPDGAIGTIHVNRFREQFTERPYDAREVRSQFSMSMANLESFHAFWSPSEKRMFARTSSESPEEVRTAARGRPALPADAMFVGTYSGSMITRQRWHQRVMKSVDAFFEDLNDALARIKAVI